MRGKSKIYHAKHPKVPMSQSGLFTNLIESESKTTKRNFAVHNGLSGDHKVKNKSAYYEVESIMKQLVDYSWKVKSHCIR